ncbi:transcriptional regulator YhjC domain protein [Bordetella bronchiseptica 00-P-2730]|nr:LysR substrate-binding domain-containing protein [Bordetella bronchiseptica]KCV28618.1 transcriptional regulator YhjC domain protein [Bordetella bronchiseptica 00-P-2730]
MPAHIAVQRLRHSAHRFGRRRILLLIPTLRGFTDRYSHIQLGIGCSERVAGLGIATLPRAKMRHSLQAVALHETLPDWTLTSMPMAVVYPQTHQLSTRVQVCVQWVAGLF